MWKSGLQVGFPSSSEWCCLSRGIEKFLLLCTTSSSKNCFYEPFGSNAHMFTKPASGSAWKKRVQKHSSATHREVKDNPKPSSPELVSCALSERCGLVRLELWSWMDEGTLLSAVHWGFGVVPHLILFTVGVLKALNWWGRDWVSHPHEHLEPTSPSCSTCLAEPQGLLHFSRAALRPFCTSWRSELKLENPETFPELKHTMASGCVCLVSASHFLRCCESSGAAHGVSAGCPLFCSYVLEKSGHVFIFKNNMYIFQHGHL